MIRGLPERKQGQPAVYQRGITMNEEEVLVGRIQDLAEQCYHRDVPSHTEFLTLAEQDLFYRTVINSGRALRAVRRIRGGRAESGAVSAILCRGR